MDKGHLSERGGVCVWPPGRSRSGCLGEGGTLKGGKTKQLPGQSCAAPKMYWPFSARCCDYRERLCWPQNYFKTTFGHIEVCLCFRSILKRFFELLLFTSYELIMTI